MVAGINDPGQQGKPFHSQVSKLIMQFIDGFVRGIAFSLLNRDAKLAKTGIGKYGIIHSRDVLPVGGKATATRCLSASLATLKTDNLPSLTIMSLRASP